MVKKKASKEFLMLAFVSIVIVVAMFIAAPSGQVVRGAASTTQSSTGASYVCTWTGQRFSWVYEYADGTTVEIPSIINAHSSPINCDPNYWYCTADNRCNAATEGQTCDCGKQLYTVTSMGAST